MKLPVITFIFISFFSKQLHSQPDTLEMNQFEKEASRLFEIFKYDSAAHYYFLSAQLYEQQENWISCARSYRLTANSFNKDLKPDTAIVLLNKAFDIINFNSEDDTKQTIIEKAEIYLTLGDVHYNLANYEKRLLLYKKALVLVSDNSEFNLSLNARVWSKIGTAYDDLGQYDKAIEYCNKSLLLKQDLYGKNHMTVAKEMDNLGLLFHYINEKEKALEYFNRALQIKMLEYEEETPNIAYSYNNIGRVFFTKGEFDKALNYFKKALKININSFGEENNYVAYNYQGIGYALFTKGDFNEALTYLNKAVQINIKIYGDNHPFVASNYKLIGEVFLELEKFDEASQYTKKALSICIDTYGKHHPRVALMYQNLAQIYYAEKNYKKALYNYHNAIKANLVEYNDTNIYNNPIILDAPSRLSLLEPLYNKARTFYSIYEEKHEIEYLAYSISTYNVVFKLIHEMRNSYSREETQLLHSEKIMKYVNEAILTALHYDKLNLVKYPFNKTFEYIEKSKGAVLSAHLSNLELKQYSIIHDHFLGKEKDIKQIRREYETKIQKAKAQKDGYDTLQVQDLQDKLFYISLQYDTLMNSLENKYPDYFNLKYKQEVANIENIQKMLSESSALVNYFLSDSSLLIVAVTKKDYIIKSVKIDKLFNQRVIDYYIDVKTDFTEKEVKSSSYLYSCLIEPIEEYLKNKSNLIIVPDENLYYIPFETLCKSDEYTGDLTGLNYLIKDYSITYHHTATLWLNSKEKEQEEVTGNDNFIGFAPVFDSKVNNGYIYSNDWIMDSTNNELTNRSISKDFKYLNPLEYSEKEVKSIVKLFNKQKKEGKGFFHHEASEENFKLYSQNYKYIHIASHSFTNDLYPNLSGIAFSQPDTVKSLEEKNEDGILYAGETYNLHLPNAKLVVLSSCKSGLGKLIQGEGFLSLSRGFLYSGVPNIIFSLWNVNDEQTKDLMLEFYKNILKGENYSSALREAKLKLINNQKTAMPKYWGAWMLVGR